VKIYLQEKIGNPKYFSGRHKEMKDLLKWVDLAKK